MCACVRNEGSSYIEGKGMCGKRIFVHYSGSFIKLCAGAVRNGNLDAGSASARTEGIWWLSYKAHPRAQFFFLTGWV